MFRAALQARVSGSRRAALCRAWHTCHRRPTASFPWRRSSIVSRRLAVAPDAMGKICRGRAV